MIPWLRKYDAELSFRRNMAIAAAQGVGFGLGMGLTTDGIFLLLYKLGIVHIR